MADQLISEMVNEMTRVLFNSINVIVPVFNRWKHLDTSSLILKKKRTRKLATQLPKQNLQDKSSHIRKEDRHQKLY